MRELAITTARIVLTVLAELAAALHRQSRRARQPSAVAVLLRARNVTVSVVEWGSGHLTRAEDHLEELQRAADQPSPPLPGVLRLCAQGFHAPPDTADRCPDCHQPLDPVATTTP